MSVPCRVVTNGSFKPSVRHKAAQWPEASPEVGRRKDLADWVADASTNVAYREESGRGTVIYPGVIEGIEMLTGDRSRSVAGTPACGHWG